MLWLAQAGIVWKTSEIHFWETFTVTDTVTKSQKS